MLEHASEHASNDFESVSLRPLLRARLQAFLAERSLGGDGLADFATEIIGSVSRYREEGKRLFPVVFLCSDLPRLLQETEGEDPIEIGRGSPTPETARRMLKLCAPLGEGRSWVVFAEASPAYHGVRYGVFRSSRAAVSATALERLRASQDATLPAAGFVQIAEGVVEARLSCGRRLYASVDGAVERLEPPTQVIKDFIESLRLDAPENVREALGRFYYRVLIDVMQVWHGTLAAVLPASPSPAGSSSLLADGVAIRPTIDVAAHVRDYLEAPSEAGASRLSADANLIRGMLAADGVTLFRSDGAVVGYSSFLHRSPDAAPKETSTLGGARQRAFDQLSVLVGAEIVAAFCRSQDGSAYCKSSWSPIRPGVARAAAPEYTR